MNNEKESETIEVCPQCEGTVTGVLVNDSVPDIREDCGAIEGGRIEIIIN